MCTKQFSSWQSLNTWTYLPQDLSSVRKRPPVQDSAWPADSSTSVITQWSVSLPTSGLVSVTTYLGTGQCHYLPRDWSVSLPTSGLVSVTTYLGTGQCHYLPQDWSVKVTYLRTGQWRLPTSGLVSEGYLPQDWSSVQRRPQVQDSAWQADSSMSPQTAACWSNLHADNHKHRLSMICTCVIFKVNATILNGKPVCNYLHINYFYKYMYVIFIMKAWNF